MSSWKVMEGDALKRLCEIPDDSVQCCVTSPPYWGLRDYGTDGQLGLEETPEEYVAKMVEVFAQVRRTLRGDGTLWLNIGDSYATGGRGGGANGSKQQTNVGALLAAKSTAPPGLKPKDLVGIPWMLAFALRADGWYLRRDIIWSKPNPMPESVQDRPTSAHEYLFLLSKSPRYFYDAEAIREEATPEGIAREGRARLTAYDPPGQSSNRRTTSNGSWLTSGRNKRSVWTIATRPFSGAHFATFPPDLVEPCILAGSPARSCGQCGAPWSRQVERSRRYEGNSARAGRDLEEIDAGGKGHYPGNHTNLKAGPVVGVQTTGWKPTCSHGDDSGRAVVLDPFSGAATTGLVAAQRGRDFVGIELNEEYAEMGRTRIRRWEANPGGHLTGDPTPLEGQISILDAMDSAG